MTLIANATKVIATRFLCASVKTKQSYHKCLALMLLSLYFSCGWGMKQCTESTKRARKKLRWRPAETKNFPRKTGIVSQCQGRKLTDIQPKYSTIPIPRLSQVGRKLPKTNKKLKFSAQMLTCIQQQLGMCTQRTLSGS